MPFDDAPSGGGHGGGDPAHDPIAMGIVADNCLQHLASTCRLNDLCEFHTGMMLQAVMIDGLKTILEEELDDEALFMVDDEIKLLTRALAKLTKAKAAHNEKKEK